MEHQPDKYAELMARLQKRMASWDPLPTVLFSGLDQGVQAFQALQRAAHIGKVVLEVPARIAFGLLMVF